MPIKLSIDNNFLKVEGNDPERIYYERSRISHDIPTGTTIQLRYDNNKLALLDTTTLDSSGAPFGSVAAITAFLTTAGDGDTNAGGTSGGNSTLTQADVQTAMTNALLSQNQVEFQQSFLEDNNGTFIRIVNINEETGVTTTTDTTLAGAPYTPVGTIRLASQTTNDLLKTAAQTEKLYYAITAGVGYSVGDEIAWLYRLDGAVIWVNKTTRSAITAPVLTDLVANIEECFHEVVTATVPASTDRAFQTFGTGVNSAFVDIPSIAGRKCNRISVLVGVPTVTSPLFSDVGVLIQSRVGGGLIVTALSSPNRPSQINIPAGNFTSWGWLLPESTRVFMQNTNLSSYPVTLRFWYSENAVETHNFGNNLPPARQVTAEANITTGTTSTIGINVDIHSIQVIVDAVGATSNVLFVLEAFNGLHGLPAVFRTVTEFVLPLGVNYGIFKGNVTLRGSRLRLRAVGTLTSFSYTMEINNDQY